MRSDEILLLTPQETRSLLSIEECIAAMEEAFRAHGEGKAPPPGVLGLHVRNGGFHIKAGMLHLGRDYFAAKVNANFPDNGARFGLPTIQGVIVLYDAEKGSPLAVMDSREITALRTAAASAVAAKHLACSHSHTFTVCGCGEQGRAQVKAVSRVLPLQRVFAYDTRASQAEHLAQVLTDELKIPVTPVSDLGSATRQSDVCITCTPSRQPLLNIDDVRAGTFIAAVGADNPMKQEIHPGLMASIKIVTDITDQCAVMGDLHHALETGRVTRESVHAELGEIVAGKKVGRESAEEIIVFDSTGMALQDVAAAATLYERALSAGSGVHFSLAP